MYVRPSRGWGFCLDDRPSKRDLTTPLARLGVRYTTHHQCQLQYGPNATYCHEVDVSIMPLLLSGVLWKEAAVSLDSDLSLRTFARSFGAL